MEASMTQRHEEQPEGTLTNASRTKEKNHLVHTLNILAEERFWSDPPDPLKTAALGMGFDTFHGKVKVQAIDTTNQQEVANGKISFSRITTIETIEQLTEFLEIDVDVEISGFLFELKSHISYLEKIQFNSYDYFAIAHLRYWFAPSILPVGQLTATAANDARTLTHEAFFAKYGDTWIRSLQKGADMYAVLHVKCETRAKKKELAHQLSLSSGVADLGYRMKKVQEAFSQYGLKDVSAWKTGGEFGTVTVDNFIEQVNAFQKEVMTTGGLPVWFEPFNWSESDWPADGKEIYNFSSAKKNLSRAVAIIERAQSLLDNGKYVLANQKLFTFSGSITPDKVQEEVTELETIIERTQSSVVEIVENPFNDTIIPLMSFAHIVFPPRK